jgi:hypothetical protein
MRRGSLATRIWVGGRSARAGLGALRASGRVAVVAGARAADIAQSRRTFARERDGRAPPPAAAARAARGLARARARTELRAQAAQMASIERDRSTYAGRSPGRVGGPASTEASATLAARIARLDAGLVAARAAGDRRRVVSLEARHSRVTAERSTARQSTGQRPPSRLVPEVLARPFATRARARLLDRAARAPAGALMRRPADAARLAGLVGIRPADYLRSGPEEQRAARIAIERRLSLRRELLAQAQPAPLRSGRTVENPPAGSVTAETVAARRRRQFERELS